MTILSGLKGYRYMRDNNLPSAMFKTWLKEKWKADIKVIATVVGLSPLVLFWAIGAMITLIGNAVMVTKEFFPDWIFLANNYRDKQFAAAEAARTFIAVRNGLDRFNQ